MYQYLRLCKRIVDDGVWVTNERTGKRVLTVIGETFTYDVANNKFPMITTRKSFWKSAVAELLGYLRGYTSAAEFRALGTPTWNANANENKSWLANPHRKGEDDMGHVYGANIHWKKWDGSDYDQLEKIYNNLKNGIDDRGEILSFWNPGEFERGCLRPCMYEHIFSILDGTLYLTSVQRSVDVPLGLVFNQLQCFVLLKLMAQITGLKAGTCTHHMINLHIYENQLDLMKDVQLKREPLELPELHINPEIKTLEDVLTWVTVDDFEVTGYEHHDPIKYPFSE
ncbi:thymidylate synthase [Vibrio owensii]|uniref:thymidylate synthase n=1 Tax=Vibrio owensii TaxID=696485 RepID=UPI003CC57258